MKKFDKFIPVVLREFNFLIETYNFRAEAIDDKFYPCVFYTRKDIAIEIRFEIRENLIVFYFIRLEDGKIMPYLEYPLNWIYLEEVVKYKNDTYEFFRKYGLIKKDDIEKIIDEYSLLCKQYCGEILNGDLTILKEVVKLRQKSI